MSLDVYLIGDEKVKQPQGSGIFVREAGQTVEISEEEWYKRNPDREPVKRKQQDDESAELYSANITHNLGPMAAAAGIYDALWRPEEKDWYVAADIVVPLEDGLIKLKENPERFRTFDPDNGWGSYEGFVKFVEGYLAACRQHPSAKIEVSR